MRVVLTLAAETDLAAAVEWYKAQAPSICPRFLDEFEALSARIADNPRQFPLVHGEIRRAGFRRFPYGLLFRILNRDAVVLACFHASRAPIGWQRRG